MPSKRHGQLQAAIIKQFVPRFASGAQLLASQDTIHRTFSVDSDVLAKVGLLPDVYSKLPNLVFYIRKKKRLFFIEMHTSHGIISLQRYNEMETLFHRHGLKRVYLTAFSTFADYSNNARQIAWGTSVWIAEIPLHIIHFDGGHLLPFQRNRIPKQKN